MNSKDSHGTSSALINRGLAIAAVVIIAGAVYPPVPLYSQTTSSTWGANPTWIQGASVGIGTMSPGGKLDVQENHNSYTNLNVTNTSNGALAQSGSEQESDQVRANGQFGGKSLIG